MDLTELRFEKSDLLKRLIFTKEDIIFIGGSLVQGIGNKGSDVDVFVITNEKRLIKDALEMPENYQIVVLFINDIRFDIEYRYKNNIIALFETISAIDITFCNKAPWEYSISNDEKDFISKFDVSISIYNEEEYKNLKKHFDREKYKHFLLKNILERITGYHLDTTGAYLSKDYEQAFFNARLMVENCIDLITVSKYNFNLNIKWRLKRILGLDNKDKDELLSDFWFFECPQISKDQFKDYIEKSIEFYKKIVDKVEKDISNENG